MNPKAFNLQLPDPQILSAHASLLKTWPDWKDGLNTALNSVKPLITPKGKQLREAPTATQTGKAASEADTSSTAITILVVSGFVLVTGATWYFSQSTPSSDDEGQPSPESRDYAENIEKEGHRLGGSPPADGIDPRTMAASAATARQQKHAQTPQGRAAKKIAKAAQKEALQEKQRESQDKKRGPGLRWITGR
eukprot:TRINITY_DN18316_c0_g1_i1.p1 TRINITY_DN18316_c0_g1~~TRINITY_DN18316_c0_g1_i1.p1  ORF type:complete len:193 (-),score=16.17 TRINITY_DN18316_c0_g1_i1:556-1134(-)